uniref:Uncharacterized protein n=1 Tax=Oryza brachyantha TaxID=4533 RepID=J3LZE3_ORYBR
MLPFVCLDISGSLYQVGFCSGQLQPAGSSQSASINSATVCKPSKFHLRPLCIVLMLQRVLFYEISQRSLFQESNLSG